MNEKTELTDGTTEVQTTQEIVVADIGGTHARFAIANVNDGKVTDIVDKVTMKSGEHASLQLAWEAYGRRLGRDLPRNGAIAVAGPVGGDEICFTNSSWTIRSAMVSEKLGLDWHIVINDFGAVGHAVAALDKSMFSHICGPDKPLVKDGIISIVGPGTGLGVAHILHTDDSYHVTETEGGHIEFAPLDDIENQMHLHLRQQHDRVSVERLASGPGLAVIYQALAKLEHQPARDMDDQTLWALALSGKDSIATAAFDRFCMILGSASGDIALAQGARSVVIAGGLGRRIANWLPSSGFRERFVAKGRFKTLMEGISVNQLLHEEPGLYGAAAAFLKEYP